MDMARRKNSAFDDLVGIAAVLPWQISLALAVVSYFVIHHFAALPPIPLEILPGGRLGHSIADGMTRQLTVTFCGFLQYLVPFALVIGALMSLSRRRRQAAVHQMVAGRQSREALESISWEAFEDLTAEVFRRKGFRVVERGGRGPDGGVDIELRMDGDKYLVQCKQWKTAKVGVATVRELYGVMAAEGAVGGFVVASGEFTEDARRFAEGREIKLIHTDLMLQLVNETRAVARGEARREPSRISAVSQRPSCPKCGSGMIQRTAKRGDLAGMSFWGCSSYPKCRGMVNKNELASAQT
jgi:restriction system protein